MSPESISLCCSVSLLWKTIVNSAVLRRIIRTQSSLSSINKAAPVEGIRTKARPAQFTQANTAVKMGETMKAVDIKNGKGHASSLFINPSTPVPKPPPGHALIKVSAFGLNRMDLIQREGHYPLPPQAPSTLGVEFSGTIHSFGSEDKQGFSIGDDVFGLAYGGAYAEYISVSVKMLLHKPSHLSFVQAAGIPETWITATQALHFVLGITKGKSILWHAGASGVSIAGIQLSKLAGASAIYATAGSPEKCEFIGKELGATEAFNYRDESKPWDQELLKVTGGKGVDLIVDFIGADYFSKNLDVVAREGRIVLLGLMSGSVVPKADIGKLLYKAARIEGSTLRSRDEEYQGRLRDKLEEYLPQFESGELKIFVDTVFDWNDIVKAHELLEANKTMGKIICAIS